MADGVYMKILYRSGPKMEPWGTSEVTGLDENPSKTTF